MAEEDMIGSDLKSGSKQKHPSILLPMMIWIILLAVGLVLRAFTTFAGSLSPAPVSGVVNAISDFMLKLPGSIIMPIVFGAIVGALVGMKARNIGSAARMGAIDGAYASIIYLVTIAVIYLILFYSIPAAVPDLTFVVEFWIAAPVAITILLALLFSVISSLRKG
ncbi:MAG: hypothetical protein KGH78_04560 [Candidatus Micrarchaeota archaeon]|nr:hypothetical protein [Candidatus Micrarchaeota archaeon]